MTNMNVQFGGQTLIQAGAYYTDDVSATGNSQPALVPPVIYIGNGYGVQPKTPVTYSDYEDIQAALRGAPASAFLEFLFEPSPDINGASQVTFIDASNNTPATFSLVNSAGNTVLTMTSAVFGVTANTLQAQVVAGSVGGVQIAIYDGFTGQSASADNMGLPFQVAYLGTAAAGASLAITAAPNSTQAGTLTITSPNPGESVTIPLGSGAYARAQDVINYLNGTGHYAALNVGDSTLPSQLLDIQTINLPASQNGQGTYENVTATLSAISYWLTSQASAFVSAVSIPNGITSIPANKPALTPYTHFTGGTNVPPVLADYASALNKALAIPGWVVFVDNNSIGVQSLLASHVQQASSITTRRPRRGVTGSAVGEPYLTAIANARSLGLKETTYCWPGIFRNDPVSGVNTLYSGLYVAAAVAGAMAGNPVPLPLTNKALTGNGLETLATLSQIDALQQGGVLALFVPDNTGEPTIGSDFTTWQADNNPSNVFNQQVACRQYLDYVLTQAVAPYIGQIASPFGQTRVRNAIIAALNGQIFTEAGNGVLAGWDTTSLVLNYTGSKALESVQVNVMFVNQYRFITVTSNIQPLNLS